MPVEGRVGAVRRVRLRVCRHVRPLRSIRGLPARVSATATSRGHITRRGAAPPTSTPTADAARQGQGQGQGQGPAAAQAIAVVATAAWCLGHCAPAPRAAAAAAAGRWRRLCDGFRGVVLLPLLPAAARRPPIARLLPWRIRGSQGWCTRQRRCRVVAAPTAVAPPAQRQGTRQRLCSDRSDGRRRRRQLRRRRRRRRRHACRVRHR